MTNPDNDKVHRTNILVKVLADIATIIMAVTSIIMVAFAFKQLDAANKERIDATNALMVAKQAESKIDNTYVKIDKIEAMANEKYMSLVNKSSNLDNKLILLDNSLKKGIESINNIETLSYLLELIADAQNGERVALDKLRRLRTENNYKYADKAMAATHKISMEYGHTYERVIYTIPWRDGKDPKYMSLNDLKGAFKTSPVYVRNYIVDAVCDNTSINKKEKLEFMYSVIDADSNLRVISAAGDCFNKTANIQNNKIFIDGYREWWEENKDKLK